ncbi:hypothetical protein BC833DRAFT_349744 [Globomyces pollinis-pini]|nr:hypothetical protein BC833DRAFT_349744 [Globomyces pollinis-pini]KAJ2994727.1 hypothetical protein HDV02_001339 [Globomyces sp. JEL0801]
MQKSLLLTLATSAFAGTLDIIAGQNNEIKFSKPSVKLNVGDTLAFYMQSQDKTVTQVESATSCVPVRNGKDSGSLDIGNNFLWTFDTPGVFYYASLSGSDCANGMRGIAEVAALPVNKYLKPKVVSKVETDKKEKDDKNNALPLSSTAAFAIVFASFLL